MDSLKPRGKHLNAEQLAAALSVARFDVGGDIDEAERAALTSELDAALSPREAPARLREFLNASRRAQ